MAELYSEEALNFLLDSFKVYSGENKIWYLFPVAVVVILLIGKKGDRRFFIGTLLIEILTIGNPYVIDFLIEKNKFLNRYPRFMWAIVFYLTIGYAMALIMVRIRSNGISLLLTGLFAAIIVYVGNPVYTGENTEPYLEATNDYFIDEEIIELDELFHSEGKEEPLVLYGELFLYCRQYDPSVHALISRDTYEYVTTHTQEEFLAATDKKENMQNIINVFFYGDARVPVAEFRKSLKKWKVDYLVSPSELLDNYLIDGGLKLLGETEQYRVWKVN